MPPPNFLIGFLCRFVLIFGLLILPWPGWDELYGHYFRTLGQIAFTREGEKRVVLFEEHEIKHGFTVLNSRIIMGNRDLADDTGKGPSKIVDLDTRSIGWVPTALTAALILATPIPWQRRCWALLWGLLLVHGLILFTLLTWIWNESPDLSLSTLTPFEKQITDDLEYTFMNQLGASFSVPVLIWLLVTFRRQDFSSWQNSVDKT